MQKTIVNGYIIAFLKNGECDAEYDEVLSLFDSVDAPPDGMCWMMREDKTMELVELPSCDSDVDDSDAVLELYDLMGVS